MKEFLHTKWLHRFLLFLYVVIFLAFILDYGFVLEKSIQGSIIVLFIGGLGIGLVYTVLKNVYHRKEILLRALIFDVLSTFLVLFCLFKQISTEGLSGSTVWIRMAILLTFVRELTRTRIHYKRSFLNPAQLFIFSFLVLIGGGTLLLMLPKATYGGISFIDALFTSTSAVCVTGLIVVDTSSHFTPLGHTLIMLLIQAGGLGILTFASYFSYFFKGGSTYENQIALSDISNSNKIGEVFSTVKRILLITFMVEGIGALLIFVNLDRSLVPLFSDRVFFSVFHSVSAFCNAGFSTLKNGMAEEGLVYNYPLQLIIILLFVFGGLGFPIVINTIRYLKYSFNRFILGFAGKKSMYRPWVLTVNSKINLYTTFILILIGTIFIYCKEFDHVLSGHVGFGKLITALFTATTPRTAGFNSIDFSQLYISSNMLIIMLMWIGASPASTGGGIKTSTFAIAILNFLSLARGKTKIEVFSREVADISVRRAFAMMALSLLVIGLAVFSMSHFDPYIPLLDIAFECFSAYSTVGLSLGITSKLSIASKSVLIITMFIGRVTMLSILIAVFKKVRPVKYSYPKDEILIN